MTTSSDDIYREGDWVRMPAYRWKQIEEEMISRRAMELISGSEKEIERLNEELNNALIMLESACQWHEQFPIRRVRENGND